MKFKIIFILCGLFLLNGCMTIEKSEQPEISCVRLIGCEMGNEVDEFIKLHAIEDSCFFVYKDDINKLRDMECVVDIMVDNVSNEDYQYAKKTYGFIIRNINKNKGSC